MRDWTREEKKGSGGRKEKGAGKIFIRKAKLSEERSIKVKRKIYEGKEQQRKLGGSKREKRKDYKESEG